MIGAVLILVIAISLFAGGAFWMHNRDQVKFVTFQTQINVLAEQAKAETALKEAQYAKAIQDATLSRDAALGRVRELQAAASRNRMSVTPQASAGTDKVCFARSKLDGAIQSFLTDIQGLIATGDSALIDNQAWLKAWPK